MPRPQTEVKCEVCNIKFLKENRAIAKTNERNGVHCCSRTCSSIYVRNKAIEKSNPFNYYLINIRKRNKKVFKSEEIITAEELESIWKSQDGKCAITGLNMVHNKQRTDKNIYQASVDRLNDDIGYVSGNVQFTTVGANYMRNTFSLEEARQFIKDIRSV